MQLCLGIREAKSWGGKRAGAGRKPNARRNVPHVTRPALSRHHPVHVTLRLAKGIASLRDRSRFSIVREQLRRSKERGGFRLVHYSVQSNHLHLLVEATDRVVLARGIQGLRIRIARALNSHLKRAGHIFGERYHAHALKSPREVRNALVYVLENAQKHGALLMTQRDPCSSGEYLHHPISANAPITEPGTWLLRKILRH